MNAPIRSLTLLAALSLAGCADPKDADPESADTASADTGADTGADTSADTGADTGVPTLTSGSYRMMWGPEDVIVDTCQRAERPDEVNMTVDVAVEGATVTISVGGDVQEVLTVADDGSLSAEDGPRSLEVSDTCAVESTSTYAGEILSPDAFEIEIHSHREAVGSDCAEALKYYAVLPCEERWVTHFARE